MILGLIPCRGGSRRLPRKNIKLFVGRPLLAWSLLEAQKSPYIDKLVVTTEDDEIAEVARDYGCAVIKRPQHLAHDTSLVYATIKHAMDAYPEFSSVCLLQVTSPLVLADDINNCIERHTATGKPTMTVELGQSVGNGAVYCGTQDWLRKGGTWDQPGVEWVAMDASRSVDINTAEDFKVAEQLMLVRAGA